jgi:hypothetical protein
MAWTACPPPECGRIATLSSFSRTLKSEAPRCSIEPIGGVAMLNLSWSLRAQSASSFIVLTSESLCTTNTVGEAPISTTGTRSLKGSCDAGSARLGMSIQMLVARCSV